MLTSKQAINSNLQFLLSLFLFVRKIENQALLPILSKTKHTRLRADIFRSDHFPLGYAKYLARNGGSDLRVDLACYTKHREVLFILAMDKNPNVKDIAMYSLMNFDYEEQEFTVKPYQQGCYVFMNEKCAHKRFPNLLDKLDDPFSMPIRLQYF